MDSTAFLVISIIAIAIQTFLLFLFFFEPGLATLFGIDERTPVSPSPPWLSPFVVAELAPRLHVAAVRAHDGRPSSFEVHRFEGMIERLAGAGYEHIVVDAPALHRAPGATLLLGAMDAVLFTVLAGRTTQRGLRGAIEQLADGKALGTVLMDATS